MTRVERILADELRDLQRHAARMTHGYECEALTELVRALDHATFALTLAPNRAELLARDKARMLMIQGAAAALRLFLERVKDRGGGVPWTPTTAWRGDWADRLLYHCGVLTYLKRLAACERFGLCRTQFIGRQRLILDVASGAAERADRAAGAWLDSFAHSRFDGMEHDLAAAQGALLERLDGYVDVHHGWFIRYDSDPELMAFYHALAQIRSSDCPEAEALPDDAVVAGRPFREWRGVSESAFGRVLHHIAFATRLGRRRPELDLRNLLTVFARKDDVAAVWEESGQKPKDVEAIMRYLALDGDEAARWESKYEIPIPYYIEFSKDFVLLPLFGGLLNAHAGLAWALRERHREEWNAGAQGRERVFRADLSRLFPPPRFHVAEEGVPLKRKDGSVLTDIDAFVLDRATNDLALIQLKWYDAVGYSLDERDSRRRNLLDANHWVDRVAGWLAERSADQVSAALGLTTPTPAPLIFVLVRNELRFTGNEPYDSRAAWIRWAELVKALSTAMPGEILRPIWRTYRHAPPLSASRRQVRSRFRLRDLNVEVRTRF